MVTINGIPVYRALITDEDCGMQKISLVDSPAVMTDFVALAESRQPMMFAVADADKHLVRGVVMRADFPIYRYSKEEGEYYIIYTAEDIRKMAEKYLADNRQNNVNVQHADDIEGVQMVQYFIKDSAAGISPAGFEEIADGSLFAEFHVHNDEIWQQIKDGTYKGFSLEGVFSLQPERDADRVSESVSDLKDNGQEFNLINMTKLQSLKEKIAAAIAEVLIKCGSITTDNGVLYWEGEEDLKAGDAVYVEREGEQVTAEDGEYITANDKTIVVVDGKVSEIKDPEAEVAPEGEETETETEEVSAAEQQFRAMRQQFEESFDEKTRRITTAIREVLGEYCYLIEAGEDFAITDEYDEEYNFIGNYRYTISISDEAVTIDEASKTEVVRAWIPKNAEPKVEEEIDETEEGESEEMEQLRSENEQLRAELEQLQKQPLAKPAEQELEASVQQKKMGNKRLDNLARILSAK